MKRSTYIDGFGARGMRSMRRFPIGPVSSLGRSSPHRASPSRRKLRFDNVKDLLESLAIFQSDFIRTRNI